jgi:large subunit ribosomal protein L9
LFGAIREKDIAEAVQAKTGVEVDKHSIVLKEPIKILGTHEVALELSKTVTARVVLHVLAH